MSLEKSKGKRGGKLPERGEIAEYLLDVIEKCYDKINLKNTKNNERAGYLRIIVGSCQVLTALCKDYDVEDLKLRLEKLEGR